MSGNDPYSKDPSKDDNSNPLNRPDAKFSGDYRRESVAGLVAGQELGKYRIESFYATGGFATTYLARDKESDRPVILKLPSNLGGGRFLARNQDVSNQRSLQKISPDEIPAEVLSFGENGARITSLDKSKNAELLRTQFQILSAVQQNHGPTIGRVEASLCEMDDGTPYLAMEFIRGKTLREKIRNLEGIRLYWFLSIVRGLDTLNRNGLMDAHRDLKPENIIIHPSGSVKIIDPSPHPDKFGGTLITSPHYNSLLYTDSKADVMAIGCMLYEILTGVLPFHAAPWSGIKSPNFLKQRDLPLTEALSLSYFLSFPPVKDLNPNAPEKLARVVYNCLTVSDYGLRDLEVDLEDFLHR